MGFGDKLKGLREQAQQAVADNKDKIQGAVQVAGEAANTKTKGKYATKIAKVGERVSDSVDKFADRAPDTSGDAPQEDSSAAPIVNEPANPVTASAADEVAHGIPTTAPDFPSQSAGFSGSAESSERTESSDSPSSAPEFE
jgi:gas vesicle protein